MPKSRPAKPAQKPKRKKPALRAMPLLWFKHLPTPCFILDKDARFIYANDAFIELTAYRAEELIGARFDTLIAATDIRGSLHDLLDLYQGHAMTAASHDIIRKTGSKMHVVMDVAPAYEGRSTKVTHAIGVVLTRKQV